MRLEAFLTDLLYDHDCVIVPGFGGLVANYRPARLNRVSNTIKPPSKHVAFNRNLTHNDGLLAHHVSRILNITYRDAQDRIEETVADYHYQLAQNARVVWEKVGIFFRDRSGHIQFIPEEQENFLPGSYGLQPIQLRPVVRVEVDIPEVIEEEEHRISPFRWKVAAAIFIPVALAGTFLLSQKLQGKGDFNLASFNPFHKSERIAGYTPRTGNIEFIASNRSTIPGLIEVEEKNPGLDKVYFDFTTDKASVEGIEVILHKTEVAADKTRVKTPAGARKQNDFSGSYAVIAGAFAIEGNADKFVAEMQQKGYAASRFGKHKGLYLVSLGTRSSRSEASGLRDNVRNNSGIKAWIFKR